MKHTLFVLLCLLLGALGILAACSNTPEGGDESHSTDPSTSEPDSTTLPPETEEPPTPPADSLTNGALPLYWLNWGGGSLPRPSAYGGGTCAWNWLAAKNAHANILCVHYLADMEDGSKVVGTPNPARLKLLADKMAYELKESKTAGVTIVGYEDAVQFTEAIAADAGYTVDQLAAVLPSGNYAYTTAWNSGSYIACVNSPEWTAWQTENMAIMAEAGFTCIQYDFHPYAAAGYFCRCKNCQASWAAYSKAKLGSEQPIPKLMDFSTELGRTFYHWKIQSLANFFQATATKAREICPEFKISMNQNANGYGYSFETLYGAWEVPSTEFHGVTNGVDSTLHMFALSEGLGFSRLYGIYNSSNQIRPNFRYKVNLAEGFATIGSVTYTTDEKKIADSMFGYAAANPEVFDTKSVAGAAVLYSAESNLFSVSLPNFDTTSQLYSMKTDRARQAATALMKSGISYDYLVLDREDAAERIAQYDLLVIPSYTYFDNALWEPVIRAAVANGSRILCVGSGSKNYLNSLKLPESADVIFIAGFEGVHDEEALKVGDIFLSAIRDTKAEGLVKLTNDLEYTAATIRRSDENHTYIHLIRRFEEKGSSIWSQTVRHTLPEGKRVTEVKIECPYAEGYAVDATWSVKDGVLEVVINDYDTYAIIRIVTE
ncbi:MAG: hypothetical protein E7618_01980 [Ruminococcaceae bacterium]|nr:hypothetical protein [Oscillospiraceae bacterium]